MYTRALQLREEVLGPEHPHVATSCYNLGSLYLVEGQRDKAAPLLIRALQIRSRSLPATHPDVAAVKARLADGGIPF